MDDLDPEVLIGMEPPPRNTAKIPLPQSSTIRKSTYGRAVLAVEDAHYQELRCSSSIAQHVATCNVYHSISINKRLPEDWTKKTDYACWHCCHKFDTPPVPIPRTYDTKERSYIVFGNFCSLECAKGYLVDNPTFESSQQMNMFTKMARDLYEKNNVYPAPSRISLQMFGGPFSIDDFRKNSGKCSLKSPPFICSYMVVEERQQVNNATAFSINPKGSVRGLRKPTESLEVPPPEVGNPDDNPYVNFKPKSTATAPKETKKKKDTASKAASSGTLAQFMVQDQ